MHARSMREAPSESPLSPRKTPNLKDATLRPIYSRESGSFDLRGFDAPPPAQAAPSGGQLRAAAALWCAVMRQRRLMLLMLGLLVAYAVLAHRRRPSHGEPEWSDARHPRVRRMALHSPSHTPGSDSRQQGQVAAIKGHIVASSVEAAGTCSACQLRLL